MADTVELVAGWIVAGLVTLGGVLLAQRQSDKGRQRQEDRVIIYEPIHPELEEVLSRGRHLLDNGYSVWSPSDEFLDLVHRGALVPKRHDALRNDIAELLRLLERHTRTWTELYNQRKKAINEKWEETNLEDEKGDRRRLADLLGRNFDDARFNNATTSLDKEGWTRELNVRVTGQGGNLGLKFKLLTSAEDLFDQVTAALAPDRKTFMDDGEALLKHVERIKTGLEKALASGRVYRAPTPISVENDQRSSAAPLPRYPPLLVYGGGIAVVIVGLILIATLNGPFVIIGFAVVAIGVVGAIAALWIMAGRIADPRLRRASRGLLFLFLSSYFLGAGLPPGADLGRGFFTDLAAGSVAGLIVLLAGEYVRRGGLDR